jgi:predicted esterase
LKSLQDVREEDWQFQALAQMTGVHRPGNEPRECFLLLHGLTERGRRIYRKLVNALPESAIIVAPNGIFPAPRIKENKMDMGYAWYIYDRFEAKYVIDKKMAISWIKEILKQTNPDRLPLTIIGFSQGGYLAPQLAQEIPETKLVIGIGCEFRSSLITGPVNFPLEGIHGEKDAIITPESSETEIKKLKDRGIKANWTSVKEASHEINTDVANAVKEILNSYGK